MASSAFARGQFAPASPGTGDRPTTVAQSSVVDRGAAASVSPVVAETHLECLLRLGLAHPRFLQGVHPFSGNGFYQAQLLGPDLRYAVPAGCAAKLMYCRAGNLSDELIYLSVVRDGAPMRYFPIQGQGDMHVSLAITESIPAESVIEIHFAAPEGLTGAIVLDVGLLEINDQQRGGLA